MKTRNFLLAIYLVLAALQLITVRPWDEALVRCGVLALAFLVLYVIVLAIKSVFRRFQKQGKTDRAVSESRS